MFIVILASTVAVASTVALAVGLALEGWGHI